MFIFKKFFIWLRVFNLKDIIFKLITSVCAVFIPITQRPISTWLPCRPVVCESSRCTWYKTSKNRRRQLEIWHRASTSLDILVLLSRELKSGVYWFLPSSTCPIVKASSLVLVLYMSRKLFCLLPFTELVVILSVFRDILLAMVLCYRQDAGSSSSLRDHQPFFFIFVNF